MTDDSLAFDEKLELRSWGLPDYILQKYLNRGITKMFPWQVECLMAENVLLGGNLIYSAPTSAGKTLVSEILALKTVLERKKKVIVILPFVSVVREKMIYFQDVLCGSGIRVEGFMGSYNPPGGFKNVHLAICTIEKANNIINRLLEDKNFDDIGCIVVDELHLLGDPHRGYLLELLLTKLKYVCQKGMAQSIQIVGMSATLPNLDLLAKWLNATLYHTEFRPIPLFEYLKVGRTLYKSPELTESVELQTICEIPNDPGDVISICLDTIIQGFSVLVFCPSKNWCEALAVQISSEIKRLGNEKDQLAQSLRSQLNSRGIFDTLEQLKKCPAGLERNLGKSVAFGVAYHHAGLTLDERDIIEGGFRNSVVRVLVATSTLSSGVNLPARRVIVRTPAFQGQCMDILTYKQMIGRAGRMGKDTAGESYLVCTENDVSWGKQLVTSQLPPVESCLGYGDLSVSLKRALLEVIAGGVVTSSSEVVEYTNCTLLAASVGDDRISSAIDACVNYLKQNEFIKVDSHGAVIPSSLAEACLSSSVPPDQALYLLKELHKARQCFVLDSDLHAIYQVTPYSICDSWAVDWMRVFTIWEKIPANLQKIGDLVGVEDRFLIRAMRGSIDLNDPEFIPKVSIHKRFYTCLALQDLINEVPINDVATKYGCNKGMLQSLQQSASTFAAMVTRFCRKLGWSGLEVLLSELATRIQFGVQKELLDLLRLDCMTSVMARSLFNAEITTLSELASSSLHSVQLAVNKAKPFKSEMIEAETQGQHNVYLPGRPGLSDKEAAEILIFEARRFLLKEMGVKTAEWEDTKIDLRVNDTIYERTTLVDDDSKSATDQQKELKNSEIQSETNMFIDEKCSKEENNADKGGRCGKSPGTELELHISGSNDSEKENNELADTVLVATENNELDISQIRKIDNPEVMATTFLPESQDKILHSLSSSPAIEIPHKNGEKEIVPGNNEIVLAKCHPENDDFHDGNKVIAGNESSHQTPSTSMLCHASETITFPVFEANAKLSSTYLIEDKKLIDKFSLDVLCGSPNNSDLDFMDSILDKIENNGRLAFSTPVAKTEDLSTTSNSDLFSNSPKEPEKIKLPLKNQTLEEFDPNWGGDSLLELSQNFEKNIESNFNITKVPSVKRKATDFKDEYIPLRKKVCLNVSKKAKLKSISQIKRPTFLTTEKSPGIASTSSKTKNVQSSNVTNALKDVEHSFGDTFEFNTQLENILKTGECNNPKVLEIKSEVENENYSITPCKSSTKLTSRPKSDSDLTSSACKNTLSDAILATEFDGSFKLSESIQEADTQGLRDIHISDSEDLINGSPEVSQRSKSDLSGCFAAKGNKTTGRSLSLLQSPRKTCSSSPKSSPTRHSSPMKYPPIGTDILKFYKSPSRKKSLFSSKSPSKSPQRSTKVSSKQHNVKTEIVLCPKTPESSPDEQDFKKADLALSSKLEINEIAQEKNTIQKLQKLIDRTDKTPENSPLKNDKPPKIKKHKSEVFLPSKTYGNTLQESKLSTLDSLSHPIMANCTQKTVKPGKSLNGLLKESSGTQANAGNAISELLLPLADKLLPSRSLDTQLDIKESSKPDNFFKSSRILDMVANGENRNHIDSIYKMKEFVLSIKTKKIHDKETQKSKIGGKIVRNIVKNEELKDPQFRVEDEAVVGVYLYGGSITYYFNMITLGTPHYMVLKNIFSQRGIKLYGFNMNAQLKLFYKCCGYIISCKIFDLSVADWLLNPEDNTKTLEELAGEYLKPTQRSPVKTDNDILTEVSLMWSLRSELMLRLRKSNLLKHFEEIEMPIQSKVLFMELTGIGFNHDIANELWSASTELMGKLEMDAFSFANHKFSLGLNADLAKVKKELNISAEKEGDHPLIEIVHNWRKLHSLKTRNLSQLLFKKEGRCHSKSSTRTVTGRIIVHDPDLQHIPRDFTVDEKLFSLRSAFVAGPGNIMISADYSQLELRILAHFSQDPILVPLLRKGDDVFRSIAAEWNCISNDKVSDELRHQVKQLTYGIIYGMGDKALGEALGKTAADASMLSARFKRSFPKLEEFVKKTIEECRQSGEVKTLVGRVRRLPGISSSNTHVRAQAERQAVNSKIQGSAADIAKKAMIEVENNLFKQFPGRSNLPSTLHTSHLVLQLHDEFIYEVEENLCDKFIPILKDTMETATFLSVPLPVVVKTGKSWGSLFPV